MRLDQLDVFTVTVQDLRFAVRLEWGEFRRIVKQADDAAGDEQSTDDTLEKMTDTLRRHIIGVEGLTERNEAGDEVPAAWHADMVDKLAPWMVQEIFSKIVRPGAQPQATDPLA